MTPPPRKYQYDETLLYEGKYGEWFWSGMSEAGRAFLRAPVRTESAQCHRCRLTIAKSLMIQSNDRLWVCEPCKKAGPYAKVWRNHGVLWRSQAACQGADLEIFFLNNRALYNQPDAEWREYCIGCPVQAACTLTAVDSGSVGTWGGQYFEDTNYRSKNPNGTGKRGRPRKQKVEQ